MFADEICKIDRDPYKDGPEHERIFTAYIHARDHVRECMKAVFGIAFESPYKMPKEKTDDMLIAECIWDAIRLARGLSRWDRVLAVGTEPIPKITKVEE